MKRFMALAGLLASLTAQSAELEPAQLIPHPAESRCSVSASTDQIDYGRQTRWQLRTTPGTALLSPGERPVTIRVACPYRQTLRLKLQGETGPNGRLRYGDRGYLQVRLDSAQIDGHPANLTLSSAGEAETTVTLPAMMPTNAVLTAGEPGRAEIGRSLSLQISLTPLLTEQDSRVSAQTDSRGALSFVLLD
ncbi:MULTISPECIES: DUF1120 domain-containing protein [Serratia]|uniref:hypothetical protein n=1 Tax=Serratia TaxID=613 RepID=UPI0039819A08